MSQTITLKASCAFCDEKFEATVTVPEGWGVDEVAYLGNNDYFCPTHAAAKAFEKAQCVGCVEGWGDCTFWETFAYDRPMGLNANDFATLRAGRCPRRTNGTSGFAPGRGFISEDISDVDAAAGSALADIILELRRRWYPHRPE